MHVTPITYRLICTNGMRASRSEAALRIRHIGDPKRLHEQLRDAVPVALAEARGDIDRWRRATEVLIDSALEEIEGLRGLGLSQGEVQAVGRELVAAGGLLPAISSAETVTQALRVPTTAYDVANAITATARDRGDVAARLTLEEAGHPLPLASRDVSGERGFPFLSPPGRACHGVRRSRSSDCRMAPKPSAPSWTSTVRAMGNGAAGRHASMISAKVRSQVTKASQAKRYVAS